MRIARILGATVLVAGLGLTAGCGGDDSTSASDASSAPEMTTSPATPPATQTAPTPTETSSSATSPTTSMGASSSAPTSASTPPVDVSQPPTTYDEAAAHLSAVGADTDAPITANRFSTPGDAIYCVLQAKYFDPSCELLSGAIKDPQVCGQAPTDFVGRVAIRPTGAEPECNTDTIRQPGAMTVQAPAIVGSARITCAVEDIGVTCVDAQAHTGFFLTQGRYEVF
ncbi:MAG TPA: hypothetical protein VNS55_15670 [Nocardioides sp.]|nr:hypothetical protein [Nocardioides sp.]HWJ83678.1 hypothetical protein [Nocardioides sp.]